MDPTDQCDTWGRLASMSDSLKDKAVQIANMHNNISDTEEMPHGIHASAQKQISAEAITGASCNDSACVSSKDPVTALCSDLDGKAGYSYLRMFCHVMGQHLQRTLERHELIFDYAVDSRKYVTCAVQLTSLQGVVFSSGKAYPCQSTARHRALVNALSALLRIPLPAPGSPATPTSDLQTLSMVDNGCSKSESGQSSFLSLLFGCMAQHMQRPPRSRDIAFTFLLDTRAYYRCVVTLRALGSLQFSTTKTHTSKRNARCDTILHACLVLIKAKTGYTRASSKEESRLLACIAKHMQRTPVEDDVQFSFHLDSNKAWRCVITLHALGGREFTTPKPCSFKNNAKQSAIMYACRVLSETVPEFVRPGRMLESR
ncbi:unnamed protein product [Polarella glacialis]|uniref:Uncharacterized protein n=1 Tax=Polarella glacialis TaxID=89957 RepID=A0A813D8T7_POLGL|nr:unnamed protein product [Polarella glacialis]